MRNLRRSFWIIACSILAPSLVNAAPIATPTPGTSTVLTAPAPNPAQFNFAPLNPLPAGQLNSNFYGLWNQFTALINALNATGAGAYGCGPCVTSIVNGAGMNASIGAQASGVGTALTLALTTPVSIANGGTGSTTQNFVDLTTTQTIAGAKTFSNALTVSAGGIGVTGGATIANGLTVSGGGALITGASTFVNTLTLGNGQLTASNSGTAVFTSSAPAGGGFDGFVFNATNSPNGSIADFQAGGVAKAIIKSDGTVQGSSNNSALGFYSPTYTATGTATANTVHENYMPVSGITCTVPNGAVNSVITCTSMPAFTGVTYTTQPVCTPSFTALAGDSVSGWGITASTTAIGSMTITASNSSGTSWTPTVALFCKGT